MFIQHMKAKTFRFLPIDIEVPFKDGQTVLEAALSNKISLPHSCGGMGSCTTCRVIVENFVEKPNSRTEVEMEIIEGRGFSEMERLSCQILALEGLVIRIPNSQD